MQPTLFTEVTVTTNVCLLRTTTMWSSNYALILRCFWSDTANSCVLASVLQGTNTCSKFSWNATESAVCCASHHVQWAISDPARQEWRGEQVWAKASVTVINMDKHARLSYNRSGKNLHVWCNMFLYLTAAVYVGCYDPGQFNFDPGVVTAVTTTEFAVLRPVFTTSYDCYPHCFC